MAQTDALGKINYVNEKFCQISGYSRDELLGNDHRILNSKIHSRTFFKSLWDTIKAGLIWQGEICNQRKDGSLYWVNTTIVPFTDESRRSYQYLAIRQDITELKKAQEQILSQQAQLINSSRLSAIGEMAAAITHEINNPLAVILGRCEMLSNYLDSSEIAVDKIKTILASIESAGNRIEKIIKSMKLLSHHQSGEFEKILINEVIDDAVELCQERLRNFGVKTTFERFPQGEQVMCRPHEIVQVLVNLLNNAFDAIKDQPVKWVHLKCSLEDQLIIEISDSGPTILEEVKKKLFTPFFSTKRVQYGTGLGLSISQKIIKSHDGQLYYDDSKPHTSFVIRLPKL